MKDYIEREAAYEMLSEYYHHSTEIQHGALRDALSRIPAADVRPVVHGEWVCLYDGNYKCSACGAWYTVELEPTEVEMNFCPNCGADMKGE